MIRDFYEKTDSDYNDAMQRLGSEAFLEKLIAKFMDDKNIVMLRQAIASGDAKAAFMAAHSLKGVALNLGFTRLAKSSSDLTELLRPNPDAALSNEGSALPANARLLFDAVEADYKEIVLAFPQLINH